MYAQLLIGISFSIASYQDVKQRAVNDLVWLPALFGAGYVLYSMLDSLELQVVKLTLVGGIALAFTLLGAVGEADSIALVFVAADPYRYSPILPLIFGAIVALGHIGYEVAVGNAGASRTIPIDKFLKEQRWIPEALIVGGVGKEVNNDVNIARDEVEANKTEGALVEVKYGVPTVAYLGAGYLAFLVYLVVFNQSAFLSIP